MNFSIKVFYFTFFIISFYISNNYGTSKYIIEPGKITYFTQEKAEQVIEKSNDDLPLIIKTICFTPSKKFFLIVGKKAIQIRETTTGKLVTCLNPKSNNKIKDLISSNFYDKFNKTKSIKNKRKFYPIAIDNAEKTFAYSIRFAKCSSTIKILKFPTGELITEIKYAHEKEITSLKFDTSGQKLLSTGADNLIKIWNVQTGNIISKFKIDSLNPLIPAFWNFNNQEKSVKLCADNGGKIFFWNNSLNYPKQILNLKHCSKMFSLDYDCLNNTLVYYEQEKIKFLDLKENKIKNEFVHNYSEENGMFLKINTLDKKQNQIVTIDRLGIIKYWQINFNQPQKIVDTAAQSNIRDFVFTLNENKTALIVASAINPNIQQSYSSVIVNFVALE